MPRYFPWTSKHGIFHGHPRGCAAVGVNLAVSVSGNCHGILRRRSTTVISTVRVCGRESCHECRRAWPVLRGRFPGSIRRCPQTFLRINPLVFPWACHWVSQWALQWVLAAAFSGSPWNVHVSQCKIRGSPCKVRGSPWKVRCSPRSVRGCPWNAVDMGMECRVGVRGHCRGERPRRQILYMPTLAWKKVRMTHITTGFLY